MPLVRLGPVVRPFLSLLVLPFLLSAPLLPSETLTIGIFWVAGTLLCLPGTLLMTS